MWPAAFDFFRILLRVGTYRLCRHATRWTCFGPINASEKARRHAALLQDEEDKTMAQALSHPEPKCRRLQLDVSVTVGEETSFTRLNVGWPHNNSSIGMRITVSIVEPETTEGHQNGDHPDIPAPPPPPQLLPKDDIAEETSLMQRHRPSTRALLDALQPGPRRQANRRIRQLIAARLQRLLRECHVLMRERQD